MKYKLVVVIREDLELSCGKVAVQVAHAAVECVLKSKKSKNIWLDSWLREGQRKVVVKAKNLRELYELEFKAKSLGLITSLIKDAGLTEVPPGTVTCLGIGPGPEEVINKVTGSLPLL
ncbi:MAG: peptidyl-tRNA hydrolase [Thermoplasmata archaeon]|nr:peptidyl-tRNA hydrolase [Thermoplasmata archaeon]